MLHPQSRLQLTFLAPFYLGLSLSAGAKYPANLIRSSAFVGDWRGNCASSACDMRRRHNAAEHKS